VAELLLSLSQQTFRDFDVHIVEDGSEVTCREACDHFANRLDIHYYVKENGGPGAARNYGAKRAQGDYLIVLGAAVYGDQPSLTLVRRCEGALQYLNEHPKTIAIVSGGMGKGETVTEARAMYDWLIAHGVQEERVLMEPQATSTLENLKYSFDIIRARGDEPQGHVAIVSSAYHLYRAKLFAQKLGVSDAAGVAAPWGYFFVMLNYFIREAFGVTHLWVLGN